ncbi:MAG: excinuclease ABC subunit UvrC [Verrucomicrobia bacterium]|nr:excinuclease ABC subunit UvrC [Verrucomicrobiota bacterium]
MQPDREELSPKAKARRAPHTPGVYLMKDAAGLVVYVGKAKDLKKRLASYFVPRQRMTPKVAAMMDTVADMEWHEVRSETEALLLEGKLIKRWRPRWNILFRDDKQFPQVRVDLADALPKFRIVRARTTDACRYFGPFPHQQAVRRTLNEMRKKFGILLADSTPTALPDGTWKLYDDARSEIQKHANVVKAEEYADRVTEACAFLEGKVESWSEQVEADMRKAAEARDYEKAASLRDLLDALKRTTEKSRRFLRENPLPRRDEAGALTSLAAALGLERPPATAECFDISHISGTLAVASMVRFVDGQADKSGYRRFKIKSFEGNDDFRSMQEVVGRRYTRLHEEHRAFPELVIIDGGLGQVGAALAAFKEHDLAPPPLIGLAKREETIVFPDGRELKLPRHDVGLALLMRIRDEAHRFANDFNAELRSRKLRESLLDEMPGLGPKRKDALLAHFGSIQKLRKASAAEIAEVAGLSDKLAGEVKTYLEARG